MPTDGVVCAFCGEVCEAHKTWARRGKKIVATAAGARFEFCSSACLAAATAETGLVFTIVRKGNNHP